MFKFVVCVALIGMCFAAPLEDDAHAETKVLENVISPDGSSSHFALETSNGISEGADSSADAVQGFYKFQTPDGQLVEIQYTADLEGYHPSGALLPTPPPIPEAIARSIEWNLAHPVKDVVVLSSSPARKPLVLN